MDNIMAEKTELQILGIGTMCPKCGSSQFSISVPDIRPVDWPENVLGSADCRGCDGNFLVKLPPELENALFGILLEIDRSIALKVIRCFFPHS